MKFDKSPKLCDEMGPGDGLDPRYDASGRKHVFNRKALQLCAQVSDTLNMLLPGLADEVLREAHVESVVPAPDSLHLLVTVTTQDKEQTETALQRAYGKMRSEIAVSIHRKKTPQLQFRVIYV